MKKLLAVIPLAYLLGCANLHDGQTDSNPASITDHDKLFGTCSITLPKVTLEKSLSGKIIFGLVISGPGMADMRFSWYVSGADTQAMVSRIPPGDMRIFTGTLTNTIAGVTHEGADTVAIIAGKTAYVTLYLRKTGNAVVDIIIEDTPTPGMAGCYSLGGNLDSFSLNALVLQIRSDSTSPQMFGTIMRNNEVVCKIYGPQPSQSNIVTWNISTAFGPTYLLKVTGDPTSFSGKAFRIPDTTRPAGVMYGKRTACDTVAPPPVSMTGCYTFEGDVDTTKFTNSKLRIFSSSPTLIAGEITQNGKAIGKVQGSQPSPGAPFVLWNVGLASSGTFILKVATDGTGSSFKSIAFFPSDTSKSIGTVWGLKISCDTLPPKSCVIDTMGDPMSCKTLETWRTYASSACTDAGMTLSWITPLVSCTTSMEKAFSWVCFECCK